jgi:hypothetical protein
MLVDGILTPPLPRPPRPPGCGRGQALIGQDRGEAPPLLGLLPPRFGLGIEALSQIPNRFGLLRHQPVTFRQHFRQRCTGNLPWQVS